MKRSNKPKQKATSGEDRPWSDATGDPGVTRRWTHALSRRMQAVLISAVRGCDGAPKHDPSKSVLWALRWDTLNPSDDHFNPRTTTSFMGYTATRDKDLQTFLGSLDQYPFHFVMHVLHAAEICGYFHPDESRRSWWFSLYIRACLQHLHVTPETKDEVVERLRDR